MSMNLDNIVGEMESRSKYDSDFYKIKEGANKLRILSDFVRVETMMKSGKYLGIFQGNEPERQEFLKDKSNSLNLKGWAWAIVRETGELKIVQFGKTILGQLLAYRKDPDYAFEDMPMPYDIDVKAIGAGTKEVEYTVVPARSNSEVTNEEMAGLNKKKKISDIVGAIIDKQSGKSEPTSSVPYPEGPEDDPTF